jgi:hypothetical protein
MNRVLKGICVFAATLGVVACTDYDSSTNLNEDGPPMIQQVRIKETYVTSGTGFTSTRRVFGFGSHPMVLNPANEAHEVNTASASGNALRVIMDELLVGNNLEEIACRGPIRDGNVQYSRVPLGTTPDDIAKCSAAQDILPRTCAGEHAVCICEIAAGCPVANGVLVAQGAPVGVLDMNQDGSADDTQLIASAVRVMCGAIEVPLDAAMSYWNPSGNQQVPAMGGFEALGPALVLVPLTGMPTNVACNLEFDSSVVDKQGEQICAPPNGDVTVGCDSGDLAAFGFGVEALALQGPTGPGVNKAGPFVFLANTTLDPDTIDDFTITPAPPTMPVVTLEMNKNIKLTFTAPGLAAMTEYTITFTMLRDSFGQAAPAPISFTFTTGA